MAARIHPVIDEGSSPKGMSKHRVEALSDGVFAIAMTVLVLGLQVPEGGAGSELGARIAALWPKFASYVLSFIMLGVLWVGHHYQFHFIRKTDRGLLWLNLLFLLTVTFLPFGTAVLGNHFREPLAVVLYGGTIVVAGVSLLLHWMYATRRKFVADELDPRIDRLLKARIVVGIGLSLSAMALAIVDTRVSLVVFLALPIVYLIRSRVDRHMAGHGQT
jgi:uncharacterized membrane protein